MALATQYYDTETIFPPFPGTWELLAEGAYNWDLFVDWQSDADPQRCRVISVPKEPDCRWSHFGDVRDAEAAQALYPSCYVYVDEV